MKVIYGLIMFCLISVGVSAQTFQIVNGDTVNRVDAAGKKQGRRIDRASLKSEGIIRMGLKKDSGLLILPVVISESLRIMRKANYLASHLKWIIGVE